MWTREELKSNAKMILKRTYWMSFVACLIVSTLSSMNTVFNVSSDTDMEAMLENMSPEVLLMYVSAGTIAFILSIVFSLFVAYPITVGSNKFFMASRENDCDLRDLIHVFTGGSYFNVIKTMFLMNLYISLWSLLFVIPGIVKAYEYSFVPYILSENPGIETRRAFELSKEMTTGHKWQMFVLDLSFLGWELLGILCCGIGILFVVPYYQATIAELYAASRADVFQRGIADHMELPGYVR